jgi:hypothetical protein
MTKANRKQKSGKKTAGIGDEAVQKATGKNWSQWQNVLDKAGAYKWPHAQIARYVHDKFRISGWWSQMVTVGYEQARGLREKHQKASGYESSVSKTVAVPLKDLYESWEDEKLRESWLGKVSLTIRKATPRKSMRITWSDGATSLDVNFYPKGAKRSQVVVQHTKLADANAVQRSKEFWSGTLNGLKTRLEN